MDKITIVLQDKTTIMELAKDPEVQIRIRDAVLDQIGRRTLKISNIHDIIVAKARECLENEYLERNGWSKELKKEWKKQILEQAKTAFREMVTDELTALRIDFKHELQERKQAILKEIKDIDVESIIREVAEKVVREKFR